MKKQLRKIKGAYAYKKTETTSVSTIELDDCINTKEEYKAVLSLLISVLEREHDLEIHDIKCNKNDMFEEHEKDKQHELLGTHVDSVVLDEIVFEDDDEELPFE